MNIRSVVRKLLPLCLILIGIAGGFYLKSRQVKIQRTPPQKQAAIVETRQLTPGDFQGSVRVMGTVIPDREVVLKARVAGTVTFVSPDFVAGGRVKKGDTLLTIEASDYKIEVLKAQSALDKALAALAIEEGSQMIAKEELRLINEASSETIPVTDLALRKPQLVQARAALDSARADFEKARLNLERTRVTAPFNALVMEKNVEYGSFVSVQGTLCTLVDIDRFSVLAQVPPDRLDAFVIDERSGSSAIVYSRYSDQTWQGAVVRITGQMTGKSRMAGVIVQVADPMGKDRSEKDAPLLLNDHVDVQILGQWFENVYALPRTFLREDQSVWVYTDGKLDIRKVDVVWREASRVFVSSGISPDDQIITSNLPAPVNGMALQSVSREQP